MHGVFLLAFASVVSWCVEAAPSIAAAPIQTQAVQIGERLTYEISWLNILAGTAVMEVTDGGTEGDRAHARFITTARSGPLVTKFYPVDNRVESLVDLENFQTARMSFRRREGRRKNDFAYTFNYQEGTVLAVKDGVAETLPIPPETLDAISCLYYVRNSVALKPGTSRTLRVHHDKKNYQLEVRVEALETVEGPWGKVNAARLLVIMPFQGIFLNQGNIRVWLTSDDRRIPVRMKAKVIIGSIVADLVDGFSPADAVNGGT
jgi:hypothetical protein